MLLEEPPPAVTHLVVGGKGACPSSFALCLDKVGAMEAVELAKYGAKAWLRCGPVPDAAGPSSSRSADHPSSSGGATGASESLPSTPAP
jgi:hypothetical protein